MPSIANLATSTSRLLKTACQAIRQRIAVLSITVLGVCIPVYVIAWFLDVFDDTVTSIGLTILVSGLPVIELITPPKHSTNKSNIGWFSGFIFIALTLFAGEKYDIQFLSFSSMFVIVMLPWSWIFWQIVRRELILVPGFALALIAILVYWAGALVKDELTFDLLLLPLPLILVAAVFWAPIASWTLKFARQSKYDRIRGPATQALAMGTLFLPATLASFTIPAVFELSDIWSVAFVTIVTIILGAVISDPLRRLFVEWGNLKPLTYRSK